MSRAVRDWQVICKDCERPFSYSDRAAEEAATRGESRPERCPDCRATHNRETARIGAPYVDLAPGRPIPAGGLKAGRLGRLQHPDRPHTADETPPPPHDPDRFGLTDERVAEFLRDLDRHQVAVVEAPTGSGKSTFLPYRLLQPPPGLPEDLITRHGAIVVTQPRIEASTSIPAFVAEQLHGARRGPGADIGFRNSRQQQSDHRNRLVYLTDGTLLNMIRRGELHEIAVIVLDEAHERSLNIDLIIALLRRELKALPHLKLIIASATIDAALFRDYFTPDFDVLHATFAGKTGFPVHDRFRAAEPIPEPQMTARMPAEVARTTYEVLRWMAYGEVPADLDGHEPLDGDVLCFLHGKRAIAQAIGAIEDLLDDDPELADQVEILPLHATLPQKAIRRALSRPGATPRRRGGAPARWRIIVSTNVAETSLTVEGIRHVVDSGLITQPRWDPNTVTQAFAPTLHSRSGLIQRRGRAGRVASGIWHCLLTEAQFSELPADTPPEITRAPLEAVVLGASAAGVSDPSALRWLPPGPPSDELRRAATMLRHVGALDGAGDPTPLGREIGASREPMSHAALLSCADTAGCAVEAAVAIAAMSAGGLANLLMWDSDWPGATRLKVDRIHRAVLAPCVDDLDAVLTIWAGWERVAQADRQAWADRRFLSIEALTQVGAARDRLLEPLQLRTKTAAVRHVHAGLAERLRRTIAWAFPDSTYRVQDDGTYTALVTPRSDDDLVHRLHAGADLAIAPTSRCTVARPPTIVALDRRRRRRWVSPLEPPSEVVEASFCVSVDVTGLTNTTPLLLAAGGSAPGEWWNPDLLPGDRFEIERTDGRLDLRAVLDPEPILSVSLREDDDFDEGTLEEAERLSERVAVSDPGLEVSAADLDDEPEPTELADSAVLPEVAVELVADGSVPDGPATVLVIGVRPNGTALVRLDNHAEQLSRLAASHTIASRVDLRITAQQRFPRDARVVVSAIHEPTGLEVVLDRTAFGIDVRDLLLERVVGRTIPFELDAIDVEAGTVEVSRTRATMTTLDRLVADGAATIDGEIIDAAEDGVFVLVLTGPGVRDDAPLLVFRFATRDLPVRPTEMRIGQAVRLQLRPRAAARRITFWVGDLPSPAVPAGVFSLEGDRLVAEEQATAADVVATMKASTKLRPSHAARLRAAARVLGVRGHQPRSRLVDVTGIRAIASADRPTGRVVRTDGAGVRVDVLGVETSIPSRYTTWDPARQPALRPGDEVPVYVAAADPDSGELRLDLRDPAANPYSALAPGQWTSATVSRVEASYAMLTTAAGAQLMLPGSEAGYDRDTALSDQLPPGTSISVQIRDVNPAAERASCTRFHAEVSFELTGNRSSLLGTRVPKHAAAAFRDHADSETRVELRANAVALRSTAPDAGSHAIGTIESALSGPLVRVHLPTAGALLADGAQVLTALRRTHAVVANVVDEEGRPTLVVAAPSAAAVDRLFSDLKRLYTARAIRVAKYRKEQIAALREKGLRIAFDGPFSGGSQPAHFTCRDAEVPRMLALLTEGGVTYEDAGTIADPRLRLEPLEPASPTRRLTAATSAPPPPTQTTTRRHLQLTGGQWEALNRPKRVLRVLGGGTILDDALRDLDVEVTREPDRVTVAGEPFDVEAAIAAILSRLP